MSNGAQRDAEREEASHQELTHALELAHDCIQHAERERDEAVELLRILVNAVDPAQDGEALEPYFVEPIGQARAFLERVKP